MNNQARSCKLKCKYNVQGICHSYGECIAKDLFIAELEKINAEIDKLEMFYLYSNDDLISKKEVFGIIDNHIAKLKGENNG